MQHALVSVALVIVATSGTPLRTTEVTDVTAYNGDEGAVMVVEEQEKEHEAKEKMEDGQSGPSHLPLVTLEVLKHLEELPPARRITEIGGLHNELQFVPQAELKHSSQPQKKWWACNWTFILQQTVINFYQILPNALDRPVSVSELWNYGY